MTVIPYSVTPEYTTEVNDDDVFVLDVHGAGDMKQISLKDFFKPVYEKITTALTSMYKFMGTVETYEDLPTYEEEQSPIPVYGILHGEHAGENFAWIVDKWEQFMSVIELSDYVRKDELIVILENYTQTGHTHRQADITNLNVVSAIRDVQVSPDDGGENIFAIDKTDGTSKEFIIKNGRRGTGVTAYRLTGLGSITQNYDGSYSPEYIYITAEKVHEVIEAYEGRILISTQRDGNWANLYPDLPENWRDRSTLQYLIPENITNLRVRLYPSGTSYFDADDTNFLYEEVVSVALPGIIGINAKNVAIQADSYVFQADENGIIQNPSEINFIAKLQNIEGDILWTARSGDTVIKTGRDPNFKITALEMYSYEIISITATCSGVSDKCSIIKVRNGSTGTDGQDSIYILPTSECFNIPTNQDGIVVNSFSENITFVGYDGVTSSDVTVSSVNVPNFMTYRIVNNSVYFDIDANTPILTNNGQITVSLLCNSVLFTKNINWTLSKQGLLAKNLSLHASSYVFNANGEGVIKGPATITFAINRQNLTSTPTYTIKNGSTVVKSGTGDSFSLTSVEMANYSLVNVEVTCEGYLDSCTIVKVCDGINANTDWHEIYTNPINHEYAQSSNAFTVNVSDMEYTSWTNEICVEYSTFDNSSVSNSGQETFPDQGTIITCFTPVIPVGFAGQTAFEFNRVIGDYRFIQTITVDFVNKQISFSDLKYDKVARTSDEIRGEALASTLSPGYVLSTFLWPKRIFGR